jgi:hypothetical protein
LRERGHEYRAQHGRRRERLRSATDEYLTHRCDVEHCL